MTQGCKATSETYILRLDLQSQLTKDAGNLLHIQVQNVGQGVVAFSCRCPGSLYQTLLATYVNTVAGPTEGDGAGGGDVPAGGGAGGGDGAAGGEGGAAAAGPVNGGSTMQRHLSFLRTYGTATDIGGKAAETATEVERGPNPSKRSRNL